MNALEGRLVKGTQGYQLMRGSVIEICRSIFAGEEVELKELQRFP